MPPRRTTRNAPPPPPAQPPKRSQLAKENEVSAQREAEIKEAFALFSVQHSEFDDESPEGVISRQDVRRCFVALEAPIPTRSLAEVFDTIDPDDTGYVPYEVFFAYAAIHLKQRDSDAKGEGSNSEGDEEEEEDSDPAPAPRKGRAAPAKRRGKGKARVVDEEEEREQIEEAYRLFTRGTDGPINLAHLRRIAKDLKQDVDDQALKDMILEANGGVAAGNGNDWRRGVGVEEFEAVMKRAGVFG